MKVFYIAVVVFASAVAAKEILHLPSYVKTCPRDSPDVDECLLNSLRHLQPYLIKGIPQLNLPQLDPLTIDEFLTQYNNDPIQAKVGIKEHFMYGLRNLEFLNVRTNFDDLNDFKMNISVFIPEVKTEGKYKMQVKIGKTEFGGKGIFNITMNGIKATWGYSGSLKVIDGVTFMKMNHLDMKPEVGDMKVYASNLFNGNEALSRGALTLANQNWRIIYAELLPYVSKEWDKMMTEIANRVFFRVPFEEIFPLSKNTQFS